MFVKINWDIQVIEIELLMLTKQKLALTLAFRILRDKSPMVSDHSSKINLPRELRFILFICTPLVNPSDLFAPHLNNRSSHQEIISWTDRLNKRSSHQQNNSRGHGIWGKFNHILKICFLKNCFAKKLWHFAKKSTLTFFFGKFEFKRKEISC